MRSESEEFGGASPTELDRAANRARLAHNGPGDRYWHDLHEDGRRHWRSIAVAVNPKLRPVPQRLDMDEHSSIVPGSEDVCIRIFQAGHVMNEAEARKVAAKLIEWADWKADAR